MDEEIPRILLVDDDEDDYVLTRELLDQGVGRRFRLHWVATYQAALQALEHDQWHAALVDYRLGAERGTDLVRQATERGCDCPLILLTGQGSYDVDVEAMEAGVSDYLVKDQLTAPLLERTIRFAIERKRAEEERRNLQAQLFQLQKMEAVGRLTAGIAHDFNNLLTAIMGFAQLLQSELPPEEPHQAYVTRILESSRTAADLVRQLMAFSRKQVMEMHLVDLNAALTTMTSMLQRLIGDDIRLQTRLAARSWPVRVDPTQLQQVVVNLVVNARDAMPGGGQMVIGTANVTLDETSAAQHPGLRKGEYVTLSVSDAGSGMSPEVQARVFEPFFTTKDPGRGTGLGLSTVFGIVKQSGGYIYAQSQLGAGTTFTVYLPRAQNSPQPPRRTGHQRS
jgi:two-component system cell cycle sensor histidine kinase/response regulator CckA